MPKHTIRRLNAHTDAFGYSDIIAGYYLYGFGSGTLTPYFNSAERKFPSQNPWTELGGAKYRHPSPYERFVRKYTKVKSSRTNRSLSWSSPGSNDTGRILFTNFPPYWTNRSIVKSSNAYNEAVTEALNKIATRKAALGVSMGESLKAASMLSSYAITLLKAIKAAKKGRWREVERIFHLDGRKKVSLDGLYPANKWLEYQYGWKPLLSDLYTQYGIIKDGLEKDEFLVYGQGSGSVQATVNDEVFESSHRIYYSRERKGEQFCITKLIARMTSQSWRRAGQVGLLNPLEVSWELVPFSFVVDWFMPIGNVLEALTARAGLIFVSGTSTYITGGSCSAKATRTTGNILYERGELQMELFSMIRDVHYTWPRPCIYVDESPFSTTRSLNALALWRSINGGGVPRHIRS